MEVTHLVSQCQVATVIFYLLLSCEAAFQMAFETHRDSTIIVFRKKHGDLQQIMQLLDVPAEVIP